MYLTLGTQALTGPDGKLKINTNSTSSNLYAIWASGQTTAQEFGEYEILGKQILFYPSNGKTPLNVSGPVPTTPVVGSCAFVKYSDKGMSFSDFKYFVDKKECAATEAVGQPTILLQRLN